MGDVISLVVLGRKIFGRGNGFWVYLFIYLFNKLYYLFIFKFKVVISW